MKKLKKLGFLSIFLIVALAILSFQPHNTTLDANETLIEEPNTYLTEYRRLKDSSYLVAVRTPMSNVTAEMVRWWFLEYLQTTEHYKLWHPNDHVWMNWENKIHGEIIGASHLVHEYIGNDLSKLRIQFVDPTEFFGFDPNTEDTFVICAKVGFLKQPINFAKMCHVIVNNADGAEMRSRFWLGSVSHRKNNDIIRSPINVFGNGYLTRLVLIDENLAEDLSNHVKEEMNNLGDILPKLYEVNND
ncbi:MAG: hypothetical protein CMD58_01740 [Gammaproteobacteria bacterium]|nr:hypothetical protein [Gammaproteobacteria bacterium]|tara:strand:- start:1268 stop:2002 length:735 start_codon:yes stop_codon:yes gene_type:complete